MTWKEAIKDRHGQWAIIFCVISLGFMFVAIPVFYRDILQPKPGWTPDDFIMNFFNPYDWSIFIFGILYLAIIHTVVSSFKRPDVVLTGAALYCAINILRTLTMYLVTLEPDSQIILLKDPISSILYPDNGFAKDLFFSGHVSTMMVLILIETNPVARLWKAAGAFIMAVLLTWQHVHYTMDIVAAPIITYGVYLLVRKWVKIPLSVKESK